ncbi:MAG: glycosyltransferase [Treponema sp.]|nr:glycosyltransferase [Treponema sp.]MCL2271279.1 glycosyltransferase [Treponema sp.]
MAEIKGLISIIVPVYNAGQYLEKCVNSILDQTYKNIEVILVNDGSIDESGAICDAFAEADKRVKVIHKQNGGEGSARNTGIDIAMGEYIGFVDNDDSIDPIMYESMYTKIKETNADICICGYRYKLGTDENSIVYNKVPTLNTLSPAELWDEYLRDMLKYKLAVASIWSKLIRVNLFGGLNNDSTGKLRQREEHNGKRVLAGGEALGVALIAVANNGITFADITPYNYNPRPTSATLSIIIDETTSDVFYQEFYHSLISCLPHKSAKIKKIIACMQSFITVAHNHEAMIRKLPKPVKLKLAQVLKIILFFPGFVWKLQAIFVFATPASLYRAAFGFYGKHRGKTR